MYAGFWRRFAAMIIDSVILGIVGGIFGFIIGGIIGAVLGASGTDVYTIQTMAGTAGYIISIVLNWLYYTILESSPMQGTLGKKILGIKVTDLNGNRISFLKANARFWSKIISGFILLIGFIMAGFTAKKQALHDIIAGTLAVKENT